MPNPSHLIGRLVNLAVESQFVTKLVQEIDSSKAGTNDQNIGFEAILVGSGLASVVGVGSPDISS